MIQENETTDSGEKSFEELLDESMESNFSEPENGELAVGRVIRVDSDSVFIDLGFKFECMVPLGQFPMKDGRREVEVGSEIEVLVERPNPNTVRASKHKADQVREKRAIGEKFRNGEPVATKILKRVKGGFSCDIGTGTSFKVFLPGSQVALRPIGDFDQMVGPHHRDPHNPERRPRGGGVAKGHSGGGEGGEKKADARHHSRRPDGAGTGGEDNRHGGVRRHRGHGGLRSHRGDFLGKA